jgi:hypothetical protein
MKPDFDMMTIPELRAYLLSHRSDDEAFYKLADRLEMADDASDLYPLPDTPENIAIMETAIQGQMQKLEQKHKN